MKATFKAGDAEATKETSTVHQYALIGNFKGQGFRVISIHKRRDLAKPEQVYNSDYSDIRIAERIN